MAADGLLIIVTDPTGAPHSFILDSLRRASFEILINEENRFNEKFRYSAYNYQKVIIAKNSINN